MTRESALRSLFAAALVVASGAPATARANVPSPSPAAPTDENAACTQGFEQAQRDRDELRYLLATQEALACANSKCDEALVQGCTRLYTELTDATPSVVFAARDDTGVELNAVVVRVDDQIAAEQLDGRPVKIDPGLHTFEFSAANYLPAKRDMPVNAGEKFRQISAVLKHEHNEAAVPLPLPLPPPAAAPARSPDASSFDRASSKIPVTSYVLASVALAGAGGFVLFRAIGAHDYDILKNGCAPTAELPGRSCPQSDIDQVRLRYMLSDVALGVGAAALSGAALFYFLQPQDSSLPRTSLLVTPTASGLSARMVTRF